MASSSRLLILEIAAGVALGVAYTLSPVSVWFGIALIGLFVWAGRGLPERERRWVLGLLGIAVALRVLAVALLFVTSDQSQMVSFFWDGDGLHLKRRALWIRNVWLGVPIDSVNFANAFDRGYGWSTYLYVIAYLQYLMGPSPYAVHLFNVALFLSAAVALFRLARSAYGRAPAMLGLGILLFLPTPFFWSVSALKESLYVFLAVVALVAGVTVIRARPLLGRALAVVLLAAALAAIGGVRVGGRAIAVLGLVGGFAATVVLRRAWLVIPVVALLGFGGLRLVDHPAVQARVAAQLNRSAVQHIGHVRTAGHSYKLLDQHFYAKTDVAPMTPGEAGRFVARALVDFVVVPLPWQIESASEMLFLSQQVVWYVLVILAVVGFVAGLSRDPLVTCLLAAFAATGAVAIALNSGNIGTMVRFRDTVVPFVVWLSALGAVTTVSRFMSHTAR